MEPYTPATGADVLTTISVNRYGRNLIVSALTAYYRANNVENDSEQIYLALINDLYD